MKVSTSHLKNGLTLVAAEVPGVESATVQIFVRAGSRNEEGRVAGLAHFLEHMVFKGTSRYTSAQLISSAADSIGAEINASTDKERTSFHFKVIEKHIDLAFDVLSDMVFSPLLDPEELEREKGVVIQEIAMYEDLPPHKASSAFEELLYGEKEPLGRDIAGKKENIRKVKREDFVTFREQYYHPERMVLSIAGKFDQEKINALVEQYFGSQVVVGSTTSKAVLTDVVENIPQDANPGKKPQVKLITKKTEQAHLVLGFRGNRLGHPDRFVETVLSAILGEGMSSRLFTEVRERRGLAYYVRSDVSHYTDTGYFGARAGVELGKTEEAIKVMLNEFSKLAREGKGASHVTKGELQKAKEYSKGRFVLGLEDTESVSDFFGEHQLLEEKVVTTQDVIKGIDAVTMEDIYRVADSFFKEDRLNLAIVGPYKDKEVFEKLLRI